MIFFARNAENVLYCFCMHVTVHILQSREVFLVSEGHLQDLPLAAPYGCMTTETPRHTMLIYAIRINLSDN